MTEDKDARLREMATPPLALKLALNCAWRCNRLEELNAPSIIKQNEMKLLARRLSNLTEEQRRQVDLLLPDWHPTEVPTRGET